MDALIETERNHRKTRAERIQGLHREYKIECNGVIVRGFVKKDKDNGPRANFMKLTMTEPFQLERLLYVSPQCWADAMAGNRSFNDDGYLTEREIEEQKATLVAWYKQEREHRARPPAHPALAALNSSDENDD